MQLVPIHALVLASFCANVPALPGLPKGVREEMEVINGPDRWTRITVPVVPMGVPAPEVAGLLSAFLYTRDERQLMRALIGIDVASPPSYSPTTSPAAEPEYELESDIHDAILHTSLLLSSTPLPVLTHRAKNIAALWRNACAMGVHESSVWRAVEASWAVIVGAVAVAGGRQQEGN